VTENVHLCQVGDAKIGDFDVACFRDEEVAGFNVAVDDVLEVEVFETLDDVAEHGTDLGEFEDWIVVSISPDYFAAFDVLQN
jgi:hypothetical protein